MAGIKDIAKMAGCSISTVSYALNGSPKVTEETRARILEIAKKLEYVPNGAARMLRARETKIIGCYLGDYSGSFYGRLLKGIREYLNDQGYELIVCSGDKSRRLLQEKMMDGALILDATFTDEDLMQLADSGHKMVLLDRELNHEHIRTVLLNNALGATLAVEQLLKREIKHLCLVTGPPGSYDGSLRVYAALDLLNSKGFKNVHLLDGDFTKESGYAAAGTIEKLGFDEPVGVFCLNDEMAIGIYDYFEKTDVSIGKDIFVIGFDNTEIANYIKPELTSIDYSTTRWGRIASEKLLALIDEQPVTSEQINVKLKRGGSC